MYQVLYRKWRPKTFSDVVGQEHVTETLKSQLKAGRIAHAYLFTGSRGTGKTTCAKILARAVNCLTPSQGNPCTECSICKSIEDGLSPDVVEMDAASNNSVDDIRSLIDEVSFSPSEAKYRVYIIDEVHMLSKSAFNALLKTLEEPPEHVIFILATTEVGELPVTILSRCQRFDFNRIKPEDIANRLMYVAEQEKIKLDKDAAMLIAAVSDGALRDALSLLDRTAGANEIVTADAVRKTAGIADRGYLFKISQALADNDTEQVLMLEESLYMASKDSFLLCKELCAHYRMLMLIKTMKTPEKILILSDDELEKAKATASCISLEKITYAISVLQQAMEKMSRGGDARTELELALLRIGEPRLDDTSEALLARISDLEQSLKSGAYLSQPLAEALDSSSKNANQISTDSMDSEPKQKKQEENEQLPDAPKQVERAQYMSSPKKQNENVVKSSISATSSVDIEEIRKNAVLFGKWRDVLDEIGKYSKAISAAFEGSKAYESGDYLLIDSDNDMTFLLLKHSAQRNEVRKAISKVTGKLYKLGPYNTSKTVDKEDPLSKLILKAEESGIEIEKH